jgi:hypothetical protein
VADGGGGASERGMTPNPAAHDLISWLVCDVDDGLAPVGCQWVLNCVQGREDGV